MRISHHVTVSWRLTAGGKAVCTLSMQHRQGGTAAHSFPASHRHQFSGNNSLTASLTYEGSCRAMRSSQCVCTPSRPASICASRAGTEPR